VAHAFPLTIQLPPLKLQLSVHTDTLLHVIHACLAYTSAFTVCAVEVIHSRTHKHTHKHTHIHKHAHTHTNKTVLRASILLNAPFDQHPHSIWQVDP